MKRRKALLVSLGLLAVVGASSALLVPWYARRQAGRLFSTLAVCLAGPERVPADEAVIRARRLHAKKDKVALGRCADAAQRVATSRWVRLSEKRLASIVEDEATSLREGRLPNIEYLWDAARNLPWDPPSSEGAIRPPEPLLDTQLPALRTRLATSNALSSGPIDRQPLDHARVGPSSPYLVLRRDATRKPFRALAWEPGSPPPQRWRVSSENGRVSLNGGASKKTVDLGPGESPELVGDAVIWIRDRVVHARRLNDDDSLGPDASLTIASGSVRRSYRSCRSARGHLIAVEVSRGIEIILLDSAGLAHWGTVKRSGGGEWSLACDESTARLAWARSEPGGPIEYKNFSGVPEHFPEHNAHRIVAVECTRSGCRSRESRVTGIDAGWYSLGGYGSEWAMSAPNVIHLGRQLLVLWTSGSWVNYRLAPLDELERAPTKFVAELSRPDRESFASAHDAYARMVAWPELRWHVRATSALVAISETIGNGATFLVRFDDNGEVSAIMPPPR